MRLRGLALVCLLSVAGVCAAHANSSRASTNRYQVIYERNLFGLKPPPARVEPQAGEPLPKITLTGITTLLGDKQAAVKVAPILVHPGQAPKPEQSYVLAEGQQDGELKILHIDERAGKVTVSFSGVTLVLSFKENGVKPPTPIVPPRGPNGAFVIRTARNHWGWPQPSGW